MLMLKQIIILLVLLGEKENFNKQTITNKL